MSFAIFRLLTVSDGIRFERGKQLGNVLDFVQYCVSIEPRHEASNVGTRCREGGGVIEGVIPIPPSFSDLLCKGCLAALAWTVNQYHRRVGEGARQRSLSDAAVEGEACHTAKYSGSSAN